jgi:hypothetical protein
MRTVLYQSGTPEIGKSYRTPGRRSTWLALLGLVRFPLTARWATDRRCQLEAVLGDRAFVERHCQKGIPEQLREVSKAHRRAVALPLDEYALRYPERDLAMALAYQSGAYTMAEIGRHFAVHYMTVSRAVRKYELQQRKTG